MRQPVCVGCDGRELLTLNSVTAPLTEPHLNVHKRSPKHLRNTRFFRGGQGVGASPGKQPRAEGRASQAQKPGQCHKCRGLPCVGAVPTAPRTLHQPEGPQSMNAPSGGTLSHQQWAHELQTQHNALCRAIIFMLTSSSKCTAGLGMGPWVGHPRILLGTWWWSHATVPCKGSAAS